MIGPGVQVPDVHYTTLDGKKRSLHEFHGKVVVLNFLASWCAPCLQEMPALNKLHEKIKSFGGTVVAIGVDDNSESLKDFAAKTEMKFPLLVDKEGHSNRFFQLSGFPETVLLDRKGRVLMTPDIAGDGASGEPVVKFVGPRDWDNPYFVELARKIAETE